jgi:hypothetical protein
MKTMFGGAACRLPRPAASIGASIGCIAVPDQKVHVGLVGHMYDQVTPDRGCAPIIWPFESRVLCVGGHGRLEISAPSSRHVRLRPETDKPA